LSCKPLVDNFRKPFLVFSIPFFIVNNPLFRVLFYCYLSLKYQPKKGAFKLLKDDNLVAFYEQRFILTTVN